MVEITDLAALVLKQTIDESGITEDKCLRLVKTEEGHAIDVDEAKEDDTILKKDERNILLIDKDLDQSLTESTINIENVEGQPTLVIKKKSEEESEQTNN